MNWLFQPRNYSLARTKTRAKIVIQGYSKKVYKIILKTIVMENLFIKTDNQLEKGEKKGTLPFLKNFTCGKLREHCFCIFFYVLCKTIISKIQITKAFMTEHQLLAFIIINLLFTLYVIMLKY